MQLTIFLYFQHSLVCTQLAGCLVTGVIRRMSVCCPLSTPFYLRTVISRQLGFQQRIQIGHCFGHDADHLLRSRSWILKSDFRSCNMQETLKITQQFSCFYYECVSSTYERYWNFRKILDLLFCYNLDVVSNSSLHGGCEMLQECFCLQLNNVFLVFLISVVTVKEIDIRALLGFAVGLLCCASLLCQAIMLDNIQQCQHTDISILECSFSALLKLLI